MITNQLRTAAVRAFDALGMQGAGRVDFRVDSSGDVWAFDTNEAPPPLDQTSYALSMRELGFSAEEMLGLWLGMCLHDANMSLYESDQNESSEQGNNLA